MFDWLSHIALWLLGALLLTTMLLVAAAGHGLRGWNERRIAGFAETRSDTQEGYVVSAALSLLALLIGFTFALAIDRYENRRTMVVEDAAAIETLYLRAQLLEEPHRSRFSGLLQHYVDNRLRLATTEEADAGPLLDENRRLITDLWTATLPAFQTIRGIDFSSSFVDSVNQVIALDAARKAARQAQIPPAVFGVLFIYAIVTAGVLGYVMIGRRGLLAGAALLALFTIALMLLSDINRPVSGTIRESQAPMERLRDFMRQAPPAVFDRLGNAVQPVR